MTVSSTPYATLLADAEAGKLVLPEFQRAWKWSPKNVVELYDSVRKAFPIGSFLFMQRNQDVQITPRKFFAGTSKEIEAEDTASFVLDGQQRLTAGLILFYGRGTRRYCLDLDFLYTTFAQTYGTTLKEINAGDITQSTAAARFAFLTALDTEEAYCTFVPLSRDPQNLLLKSHLLDISFLRPDNGDLDTNLAQYKKQYPARAPFLDYMVRDHFSLRKDLIVPVTVVEEDRPVEAICRIFATLNTTGRPLTPFELVISLLYPHGIRLRDDVESFQSKSTYYRNMDATGEILLQTIALLAGGDPKKARLPRTITPTLYLQHKDNAYNILEQLGEFLSARLGVGLNRTNALIPYDSVFAPMAIALSALRDRLSGEARTQAEQKLERWFVLAALDRRYQEGVHNKQKDDPKDFEAWAIEGRDAPAWIKNFRTPSLQGDSGAGARPALLKCLINRNGPKDLLRGGLVGFREHADSTAIHHFFPMAYCRDTLKIAKSDLALNLLLTSVETNATWSMSNPHDQLRQAMAARGENFLRAELDKQFVDKEAFEILVKPNKTAADFQAFIEARERRVVKELEQWGVVQAVQDTETSSPEDEP